MTKHQSSYLTYLISISTDINRSLSDRGEKRYYNKGRRLIAVATFDKTGDLLSIIHN